MPNPFGPSNAKPQAYCRLNTSNPIHKNDFIRRVIQIIGAAALCDSNPPNRSRKKSNHWFPPQTGARPNCSKWQNSSSSEPDRSGLVAVIPSRGYIPCGVLDNCSIKTHVPESYGSPPLKNILQKESDRRKPRAHLPTARNSYDMCRRNIRQKIPPSIHKECRPSSNRSMSCRWPTAKSANGVRPSSHNPPERMSAAGRQTIGRRHRPLIAGHHRHRRRRAIHINFIIGNGNAQQRRPRNLQLRLINAVAQRKRHIDKRRGHRLQNRRRR